MAGIDELGTIVARSVLSGDIFVLVKNESVSSPLAVDCDCKLGILATVVGPPTGTVAMAVEIHVLDYPQDVGRTNVVDESQRSS